MPRTEVRICPVCSAKLDGCQAAGPGSDPASVIKDGDYSICGICRGLLRLVDNKFHWVTQEEFYNFDDEYKLFLANAVQRMAYIDGGPPILVLFVPEKGSIH